MSVIWMDTVLAIGTHNMPVIWIFTVLGGTICLLFGWARYKEAQYACYLDGHGIGRHNYACNLDGHGIGHWNAQYTCYFDGHSIGRHNMPVIWMARYWEAQYACYLDIYGIRRNNMPVI